MATPGALSGIRVLDLSRVFSGPWAGQMLADFGADVIKVERPVKGDETRVQGFRLRDAGSKATGETSSFISMNRGKRSVTLDIAAPEGQALARRLAAQCDVVLENFKAGDLARYGLDWSTLSKDHPRLVYCSISGFGQTGPYSHQPGYDPIFQGMSGLMSITGIADGEPGAGPMKVGYAVSDITTGFYAVIAILAALRHRDVMAARGEDGGQHIDLAMLDAQIAAMSPSAMNYLVSGNLQPRMGTGSMITCPYQAFECADGHIMIAVGNDVQFRKYCNALELPALPDDPRFATTPQRARNQKALVPLLAQAMARRSVSEWRAMLDKVNVPCGPIYDFQQAFDDPQVRHREVLRSMPFSGPAEIPMIANPIRFSATPVSYDRPPPLLGEHTREVFGELLGLGDAEIDELAGRKIV